MQSDLDH